MRIHHIALWTRDLDAAARFWADYFGARIGERYESGRRPGFTSRFVHLEGGAAIELMTGPWVAAAGPELEQEGWAHIAVTVGPPEAVRTLAGRLQAAGLLVSVPRLTGDGFYEAVARTPDGALVEITAIG